MRPAQSTCFWILIWNVVFTTTAVEKPKGRVLSTKSLRAKSDALRLLPGARLLFSESMPTNVQSIVDYIKLFFAEYAIKVLGAVIILAVGLLVARWIGRMLQRSFERRKMEPPLR